MKCVDCKRETASKAIVCGLPVYFCEQCSTMWGFWSWFYFFLIAPIEGMINGGFSYMLYDEDESYINALVGWFKGPSE